MVRGGKGFGRGGEEPGCSEVTVEGNIKGETGLVSLDGVGVRKVFVKGGSEFRFALILLMTVSVWKQLEGPVDNIVAGYSMHNLANARHKTGAAFRVTTVSLMCAYAVIIAIISITCKRFIRFVEITSFQSCRTITSLLSVTYDFFKLPGSCHLLTGGQT